MDGHARHAKWFHGHGVVLFWIRVVVMIEYQ